MTAWLKISEFDIQSLCCLPVEETTVTHDEAAENISGKVSEDKTT